MCEVSAWTRWRQYLSNQSAAKRRWKNKNKNALRKILGNHYLERMARARHGLDGLCLVPGWVAQASQEFQGFDSKTVKMSRQLTSSAVFFPRPPHVCSPELESCQSPTKRHERRSSLTSVVDSLQATDQKKKKHAIAHLPTPRSKSSLFSSFLVPDLSRSHTTSVNHTVPLRPSKGPGIPAPGSMPTGKVAPSVDLRPFVCWFPLRAPLDIPANNARQAMSTRSVMELSKAPARLPPR